MRNLKALIYFTDGDGIYPRQKPDYETAFVFVKKTEKGIKTYAVETVEDIEKLCEALKGEQA